jgi:prolyl oligopeptidase
MRYPPTSRLDLVEKLHDRAVADPYRWLEDPAAPDTIAWSQAQATLFDDWIAARGGRGTLRDRIGRLLGAGLAGAPVVRQGRWFFERRLGDQEHPVLIVREADGSERALVDPGAMAPDGTVTLDGWFVSLEGARIAYQLSRGGDEEPLLWVLDVATGDTVEGPIERTRACVVAWLPGGEEYIYGRRLGADQVPEGEGWFHRRVWRHRVGAPVSDDQLLFGEGRDKTEYHDLSVSEDGRWLVIGASVGTAPRNDLYIADLSGDGVLRPVQEGVDAETWGGVEPDGKLWLRTSLGAPRFRVVVADPTDPAPGRWREVVAESEGVLDGFVLTDDAVVVARTVHAVGGVHVHDRTTGAERASVPLPGPGSVVGLTARLEGGDEVWIGYSDFTTPPMVFRYQVSSGGFQTWMDAPGTVELPEIVATQESYRSGDGTEVRMFVLRRRGLEPNGDRPTILYGYGGFNIALTPAYSATIGAWVEQGGVYAIAGLRGGSEEGEAWHRAGMRERKQNVFDDFAAAAEHLFAAGYTRPDRLAISGGSNGGLLVGAALTQRPELFRAVVCSAPLLDMVRYERFGLGETWNDEYGRADDPVEFGWLYGYSPYHHVAQGTSYPAVLFTVFESDTRVDPLHARKLCAALQWATSSDRPVLLRAEREVGHGARSVARTIDLQADVLAFVADQIGLAIANPDSGPSPDGQRPAETASDPGRMPTPSQPARPRTARHR